MDRRDAFMRFGDLIRLEDIDKRRMLATIRLEDEEGLEVEHRVPIKFEVCPMCDGKGSHVNPAIDAEGITMSEWQNEWDEEERSMYLDGGYDMPCCQCSGQRVVTRLDRSGLDPELLKKLDKNAKDEAAFRRICMAEIEMGA